MSWAEVRTALLRADAGARTGSGHVVRCLTLASALADRGVRCTFATRGGESSLADRIAGAGHGLIPLDLPEPEPAPGPWSAEEQRADLDAVRAGAAGSFDLVVVDHYRLDADWERAARDLAARVVVVDDLDDRHRDADVLVDHNWYGPGADRRYTGRVPAGCRLLLGPRYALLQPAYAEARRTRREPACPPRRVLVSFGGTDPTGETEKVLTALQEPDLAALEVDVVVGTPRLVTDRLRALVDSRPGTRLHVQLPTLAPLLARADLALGAGGSATWERICLGTPALVTAPREDQAGVTRALAAAGLTTFAGLAADTTVRHYAALLRERLTAPRVVPPPLVDGLGAQRVAEALVPRHGAALTFTPATSDDLPTCLGVDLCGPPGEPRLLDGPGAWEQGAASFRRDTEAGRRLVVRLGDLPVGWVRQAEDMLTVALDDAVAGRGLEDDARVLLERSEEG